MRGANDLNICIFGADAMVRHINALAAEIEGVRQAEDIEFIHRTRVATRRLRTTFALFSDCLPAKKAALWQKQIRKVTQALGAARDLDVQIDLLKSIYKNLPSSSLRPGVRRLILRLSQAREKRQRNVIAVMDELVSGRTLEELKSQLDKILEQRGEPFFYPFSLYDLSAQSISGFLDHFLSYAEFVHQPEDIEELHAMRIAAKRLRYALETFAPLYPDELKRYIQAVRKAQELLGDIHDCDVWAGFLPVFIEKERKRVANFFGSLAPMNFLLPGLSYFEQNRAEAREQVYNEFVNTWDRWCEDQLWGRLKTAVQKPVFEYSQGFPPAKKEGGEGQGLSEDAV